MGEPTLQKALTMYINAEQRHTQRQYPDVLSIKEQTVRDLRRTAGLTQRDLASRTNISQGTISRLEAGGNVQTTAGTVERIAMALGVDVLSIAEAPTSRGIAQPAKRYQSVFISYGGPDEAVARLIYNALRERGIDVFFFPESAVPGDKLHRTMSQGVLEYDRVLLVCSRDSLHRPGVLNEIERVLEREASEGGSDLLIPITLDSYIYDEWNPERHDVKVQIRSRVVGDFRGAAGDGELFSASLRRVLAALETTNSD